jgi:hypothetical protein
MPTIAPVDRPDLPDPPDAAADVFVGAEVAVFVMIDVNVVATVLPDIVATPVETTVLVDVIVLV